MKAAKGTSVYVGPAWQVLTLCSTHWLFPALFTARTRMAKGCSGRHVGFQLVPVCGLVSSSKLEFGNLAKSQMTFGEYHLTPTYNG